MVVDERWARDLSVDDMVLIVATHQKYILIKIFI